MTADALINWAFAGFLTEVTVVITIIGGCLVALVIKEFRK